MAMWERPVREDRHQQQQPPQHQRSRRTPSFSSTLLDAIYHSIDESQEQAPDRHCKKKKPFEVEEEIACLRRAIKVEKWMEIHGSSSSRSSSVRSTCARHMNTDSSSSSDSSLFSSEAEYSVHSASKSTPKTGDMSTTPKQEGKLFTRTKSRAMKMYGDLKKVKQPISPGGKIANFLNSIFTPRNLKKQQQKAAMEEWSREKSRSVKDPSPRSCLMTKNHILPLHHPIQTPSSSSSSKSKRSVRFCPVSVIVDEDCQPCGQKNTYSNDHNDPILTPMPKISSHFLKKNIDSFRVYEENNSSRNKKKRFYEEGSDDGESSCASSDLFELQNINGGCHGAHREELPVYGTTNLKVNQAIANGFGYVG